MKGYKILGLIAIIVITIFAFESCQKNFKQSNRGLSKVFFSTSKDITVDGNSTVTEKNRITYFNRKTLNDNKVIYIVTKLKNVGGYIRSKVYLKDIITGKDLFSKSKNSNVRVRGNGDVFLFTGIESWKYGDNNDSLFINDYLVAKNSTDEYRKERYNALSWHAKVIINNSYGEGAEDDTISIPLDDTIYYETCFDEESNRDETSPHIDCGGSCNRPCFSKFIVEGIDVSSYLAFRKKDGTIQITGTLENSNKFGVFLNEDSTGIYSLDSNTFFREIDTYYINGVYSNSAVITSIDTVGLRVSGIFQFSAQSLKKGNKRTPSQYGVFQDLVYVQEN